MIYSLALRNPYYYKKKFPIALLHFTAGFLLLVVWSESRIQTSITWLGTLLLVFGVFELIFTFFAFKVMHRRPELNNIARIVTSCSFLFYTCYFFIKEQPLFAFFMLLISVVFSLIYWVEKKWSKPFEIKIDEQGVLFPGTFKSPLIPWKNFNNVIIKDNILTLDLTSNRILQMELQVFEDKNKVKEINLFCIEKIRAYSPPASGARNN